MADDPIAIVPYDPEWPRRFEAERTLLERVLAPWVEGGVQIFDASGLSLDDRGLPVPVHVAHDKRLSAD